MKRDILVTWLLRLSIAIVFAYAAIGSFVQPAAWIGFLPQILRDHFPANMLLMGFSLYEIFLVVWILSGKKTFYAALLAATTIVGIIISNLAALEIVFRDIAIFFAALALAVWSSKNR